MNVATVGSLFSGCGGLDLGLERAGLRTVWHAQHDPDSRKQPCDAVLARHWPGVPNLGDITAVDWSTVDRPDVLAGGFPCQDVSHAGLRAGLADGTRSGLWFEFLRGVRVLRPRVVVVENVPGLLTAGFGLVMAGLAEAGYDASWCCFRAADLGAPHGRERIFVVATDAERLRVDTDGRLRRGGAGAPPGPPLASLSARPEVARAADALADGTGATSDAERERSHGRGEGDTRSTPGERRHGRPVAPRSPAPSSDTRRRETTAGRTRTRARASAAASTVSRSSGDGCDERRREEAERAQGDASVADGDRDAGGDLGDAVQWGVYESAVRRWEWILGRAAPRPTDARGRLAPEFVEWMLGFPAGWTDGVTRTARLKMLGNAVQVQAAELVGLAVVQLLEVTS